MTPLERFRGPRPRGVLFDLDDTLLTRGVLEREAYDALWALHDAGFGLVAVTGRPCGWGEVLARQWPVLGVVAENGALVATREGVRDPVPADERARRRARLGELVRAVGERFPDVRLAGDVEARRADVTWDIGERARVAPERVRAMEEAIAAEGARTFASSVHLHGTFDAADKASGALRALRELAGEDAGAALGRWAFVGDSGNDRACFAAFELTFGVANVREHLGSLGVPPRWVAPSPMGRGFAEIARALLAAR